MELKVWVEGIQRIVCGVTEKTTCQDVVYALAHATGKTGRFTLIERWRNNERLLAPQEHPLKVLTKWGEYSSDVQFILQRSPLDPKIGAGAGDSANKKAGSVPPPGSGGTGGAIWKPPPPAVAQKPANPHHHLSYSVNNNINNNKTDSARLSPDSGQGSDPTGSDTSNWSDQEKARVGIPSRPSQLHPPPSGHQPQGWAARQRLTSPSPDRPSHPDSNYGYSSTTSSRAAAPPPHLPPYRHPPHPGRNASPAAAGGEVPPPYREPPPPPGHTTRTAGPHHNLLPPSSSSSSSPSLRSGSASSAGAVHVSSPSPSRTVGLPPPHPHLPHHPHHLPHSPTPPRSSQSSFVRAPHYSPPPHHRDFRGGGGGGGSGGHHVRGPSPGRSLGPSSSPSYSSRNGGQPHSSSPARGHASQWRLGSPHYPGDPYARQPESNYRDLVSLVNAQQTRLQSQHAEIKHCDNELRQWSYQSVGVDYLPSQLEAVLAEVRRLEDAADRNQEELTNYSGGAENNGIRNELEQLKHRLEMTDLELQKTNATLRRLGDEMRSYSQEKSKQREEELKSEMERIQQEIRVLQKSSEDSETVSDKLNREVQNVELEISLRKDEVERLIQDMKSANLESLTISPPEESKAFLDGGVKPGSTRKMMGSPRQLENQVPTAKNPHGVWV